jgi:nicotinate-nucleotide adenylyltransferase
MKTGLFFGSFNPVHIGHLAIANYMAEFTDLDQVWFVVSPQNPLKKSIALLEDHKRRTLIELAIGDDDRFRMCDIEFRLPKPSYTIDTLIYLKELYPAQQFVLIMGSDGLSTFHKWKNHSLIEEQYERYVYPRPGFEIKEEDHKGVTLFPAPQMEISSTFIRNAIKDGHNIRWYLPPRVYTYISEMHFYER